MIKMKPFIAYRIVAFFRSYLFVTITFTNNLVIFFWLTLITLPG